MIKLTFDFPPVAQARPRATRFGRGIRLYDPKKVHVYKTQLPPALTESTGALRILSSGAPTRRLNDE